MLCVTRALWQSWKKHRNIKPFVKVKCVHTKNFFIHIKIQEIILLRIVMDYDSTYNTVLWLPYQVRRNSVCVPYEFFLVVNNGLWNTANHTIWRSRQQTALHSCKDSCTYKYTNSQWWRQLNQKFISMANKYNPTEHSKNRWGYSPIAPPFPPAMPNSVIVTNMTEL